MSGTNFDDAIVAESCESVFVDIRLIHYSDLLFGAEARIGWASRVIL